MRCNLVWRRVFDGRSDSLNEFDVSRESKRASENSIVADVTRVGMAEEAFGDLLGGSCDR